ncbi:MAG: DUF4167 domain-containing protein [Proteobacteria bacterium]|nr:DUF4167 domain-containing protein [Pseudomonadota bacterium]
MKQPQSSNNRRSRSRGGGKRSSGGGGGGGGGGGRNSFESNGPDVKIRGSAQQVSEKYLTLARDASSSGDWVTAEAYFQYAEHYHRIVNAAEANNGGNKAPVPGPGQGQGQGQDEDEDNAATQQPRAAQKAPPAPDQSATKNEAEVIDMSPAALAAAVAMRENQGANPPKVAEAAVESAADAALEAGPEKAAS